MSLEVDLAVYRGGVAIAEARGYRAGYADGREAQALDDDELVEALGRHLLDQERLGRDVSAVVRATIADLRALEHRQRIRG